MLQVLQVSAAQEPQALPLTGVNEPSSPLAKEAKRERTRAAFGCPLGQVAGSSAWLMGRSSSNFSLQVGQKYSYKGMVRRSSYYHRTCDPEARQADSRPEWCRAERLVMIVAESAIC